MYSLFAIIIGMVISVMISFNGTLQTAVGVPYSLIIIHAVGLISISLLMFIKKEKMKIDKSISIFLYSGGLIGIALTLTNMATINTIGVALTTAFGIFGQLLFSSIVDHFGLLGMTKYPFDKRKLVGFLIILIGLIIMTV